MAWVIACQPSLMVHGLVARYVGLPIQVPAPVSVNHTSFASPKLRTHSLGPSSIKENSPTRACHYCFSAGWFCHGGAYPPLGAPSRCEVVEVQLLFHWLRSHVYPNSTQSQGDWVMAISLVTWIKSGKGLCLMLPSLPSLLGPLVTWVCGLPSRGWLQTFGHPSHWIWWPLTWQ